MKLLRTQHEIILSFVKQLRASAELQLKYKSYIESYCSFYKHRHFIFSTFTLTHHKRRAILCYNKLKIYGGFAPRATEKRRLFYGIPIILVRREKTKKPLRRFKKRKYFVRHSTAVLPESDSNTDIKSNDKNKIIIENSVATCDKQINENSNSIELRANGDLTEVDHKTEADLNGLIDITNKVKPIGSENIISNLEDWKESSSNDSFHTANNDEPAERHKNENECENAEVNTSPGSNQEDVNELLRQQLKLLKMGKKEVSLLGSREKDKSSGSSRRSTVSTRSMPSRRSTIEDRTAIRKTSTGYLNNTPTAEHVSKDKDSKEESEQEIRNDPKQTKNSGGFIDSLYNKLKLLETSQSIQTRSARNIAETKQKPQLPGKATKAIVEQKKSSPTNSGKLELGINEDSNHSTCSSSNAEFLGFETTFKNGALSGLLPTPRVPKSSNKQAVFVSEDLDSFMKENSLENVANVTVPVAKKMKPDEALLTIDAAPPSLTIQRPLNMTRPRTLAQKRQMLQRQTDLKSVMFENESSIYHELRKRVKYGSTYDNSRLRNIQNIDVPFTRDCWRAASWLNTDNNKFYYQTVKYNDSEVKILSGRGNNAVKLLCDVSQNQSKIVHKTNVNVEKKHSLANVKINNFWNVFKQNEIKSVDMLTTSEKDALNCPNYRKLYTSKREYIRPGPMCKKTAVRSSFDYEFGPLETLKLPKVQLEVWPAIDRPLPDHIKPHLKQVIPDGTIITEQWANFAVSVVKTKKLPQKHRRKFKKQTPEEVKSFVFDIPFEHNQKKILVRRRRISTFKNDCPQYTAKSLGAIIGNKYQFTQNCDPSNELDVECSAVLTGLLDSVVISMHSEGLIKYDPDIDYIGKIVPVEKENVVSKKIKSDKPALISHRRKSTITTPTVKSEDITKTKIMYVFGK